MYRVGRDGAWFLKGWVAPRKNTDVVLVFGEIDVRCHLGRISDSLGQSREEICAKAAEAFLDSVVESMPATGTGRVVVSCVPPPADGPGLINSDFPVYGTWADRAQTTKILNRILKEGAVRRGLLFLDFSAHYSTPEGFLVAALSDGSVHIDRPHAGPIIEELSKLLNRPLHAKLAMMTGKRERIRPTASDAARAPSIFLKLRHLLSRGATAGGPSMGKQAPALLGVHGGEGRAESPTAAESFAEPFELGSYDLPTGAVKLSDKPLVLSTEGASWSFIATWNNALPIWRASGRGVRVEAELQLEAGEAEFGIIAQDFATFIDLVQVKCGAQRVVLEARDATAARSLVLRNRQGVAKPVVTISALRSYLVEKIQTRQRGFLAKSAIDDLKTKLNRDDPVIIDVGANVGDTVTWFLEAFPKARIWAVEPHPDTFGRLQRRLAGMSQVRAKSLALSSRSGSATMYSYTNSAINALSPVTTGALQLMEGQIVATQEVVTPVQTLPEFIAQEQLDRIDILKLDTQGHEEEILGAALTELSSGKIKFVLSELIFCPLYERQSSAGKLIALLEGCGFKLFDFYDFVYDPDQGLKWGDALFEYVGV
jgi:FkbM family methyltransferase